MAASAWSSSRATSATGASRSSTPACTATSGCRSEPADSLARHEVLRLLRARRFHPLSRAQGGGHQGLLPELQRGPRKRFRYFRWRQARGAPRERHQRLAHHVRQHRPAQQRRAADLNRPILWHVMKYYAYFGHDDFILCLGHKAEVIKDFFLNYNEALANDFVLSDGGKRVELLASDISDWRITFVNTGLHSNVGQRLKAVERHLVEEATFLATYGDAVTDAPLPD